MFQRAEDAIVSLWIFFLFHAIEVRFETRVFLPLHLFFIRFDDIVLCSCDVQKCYGC